MESLWSSFPGAQLLLWTTAGDVLQLRGEQLRVAGRLPAAASGLPS